MRRSPLWSRLGQLAFVGQLGLLGQLGLSACGPPTFDAGPRAWFEPVPHEGDAWLFSHERINRVDIDLGDDAVDILRSERRLTVPRNEVRGTVTIDGESAGEVGLRLRGHLGSFQRFDRKPKWNIDFNEFSGERFHGLEGLALNNGGDPSFVGEAISHAAFAAAGVSASRTGYAQVFVNGQDHGLFLVLEAQDDRWLKRLERAGVISDRGGNFYDGSYRNAGWIPVSVDFGKDRDDFFDLEEGSDVGFADIAAVSAAVDAGREIDGVTDELERLVDWPAVQRFLAVEQWIGNRDGYSQGSNNYRVYFPPDGGMQMNGWDVDLAYRKRSPDDEAWATSNGSLAELCRLDARCFAGWVDVVAEVADSLDQVDWQARLDGLVELTAEAADGDPRSDRTPEDRDEVRESIRVWVGDASERLRDAYPGAGGG